MVNQEILTALVAITLIVVSGILVWASNFNPLMVNIFAMVISGIVAFYFGVKYAQWKLKGTVR